MPKKLKAEKQNKKKIGKSPSLILLKGKKKQH